MLYEKYRPEELGEVFGNKEAVASMKSILKRDRADIPHAFLFHGPAGCGKTTMGRILAKELGCEGTDFQEVNSANFRGIDTIRDLIKSAQYRPNKSSCRVWLIDEVHQWSKDAQDAALKLLEDTPKHIYFILCTTDPKKLSTALKSRCTQFEVKSFDSERLIKLMHAIMEQEGKEIADEVLEHIAQEACGSARAALVVLDSIMDLEPKEQIKAATFHMLGENEALAICQALCKIQKPSWKEMAKLLSEVKGEPESIRRSILGYCSGYMLGFGDPKKEAWSKRSGITPFDIACVMDCFTRNYFDSGKAGLILSCFEAISDKK